MDKVIKCEKQGDHVLLTFEDGTTNTLCVKALKELTIIEKDPSLKFCKEVFDRIGAVMMRPPRDGRSYSGYNLFIHTNQATIKEIIRLEYELKGERLIPPQVAGKLWKADKKEQVLYNLAVQWVNEWNKTDFEVSLHK